MSLAETTRPSITADGRATLRRLGEARLPTHHGEFRCLAYESGGFEHLALVTGDVVWGEGVLTRVHSECLTGDLFGSRRCDCGAQLDEAMRRIATEGRGVIVYLRGHEGRGIGIGPKLQAYQLQELGFDTVDANVELGYPVDCRDFAAAAWILADIGVSSVRLLTNNPAKVDGLAANGTSVLSRVPLPAEPNPHNFAYLRTKQARLGHLVDGLDTP
jgi:3,4-dihydroxy 2-butanone 4-phosphate synthase/GTP cyclohydrolase II